MRNHFFSLVLLLLGQCPLFLQAQTDSTHSWAFSGYGEFFYTYDFSEPKTHERPGFLYNHDRSNEINANLLLAKAAYSDERMRGNLGLMAGTYPAANLAGEPGVFQHVFEANAGVRLSKTDNLWLDVGIMPSHIGFESAIGADCWTLSRSMAAENSPYFETGAKLSYGSADERFTGGLFLLNGWQNIYRREGYNRPAAGLQLNFKPKQGIALNYSNFLGSFRPDTEDSPMHFHNFYGIFDWSDKFGTTLGFDLGSQDGTTWMAPQAILRFAPSAKTQLAARIEYFHDPDGVVVGEDFKTLGYSLNLDLKLTPQALLRLEGRYLSSREDGVLLSQNEDTNFAMTAVLAVRL